MAQVAQYAVGSLGTRAGNGLDAAPCAPWPPADGKPVKFLGKNRGFGLQKRILFVIIRLDITNCIPVSAKHRMKTCA